MISFFFIVIMFSILGLCWWLLTRPVPPVLFSKDEAEKFKDKVFNAMSYPYYSSEKSFELYDDLKKQYNHFDDEGLKKFMYSTYHEVIKEYLDEMDENNPFFKEFEDMSNKQYDLDALFELIKRYKDSPDYSSIIRLSVKGISYRTNKAQDIASGLKTDDVLVFEPEPNNPYDPHAVKIFAKGVHIGYVEAAYSKRVTSLLDRKHVCKVSYTHGTETLYVSANAIFYLNKPCE